MKLVFGTAFGLLMGLSVLIAPNAAAADDTQLWAALFANGPVEEDSRYLVWFDGHARFSEDVSRLGVSIIRPGVGYRVNDRVSLWAGYAWVVSRADGRDSITEHRIWQQLTWRAAQPLAGITLSTRSRLEQRMIESAEETGWRARQLVKLTYPLGAGERVYLALWDEVFVNLDDTDWGADDGFDQNRAFAGIGLKFAPHLRTEIGYMNQYIARSNRDDASNHVLSLTLFLDF